MLGKFSIIPTLWRRVGPQNVTWKKWQRLKHWLPIGIGIMVCIYPYHSNLKNTFDKTQESVSPVTNNKKCFQQDILSFLGNVSFLRHNRELKKLDKINILCLLGPSASKEHILPYLVYSDGIVSIEPLQEGVERVVGDTTCVVLISMDNFPEAVKKRQLAQIKYLLRGLATWKCAAVDGVVGEHRFGLWYRFLLYFRHRLSETAHAVLVYSPLDTEDIVIQRTMQVAMKEGIPLLVISDNREDLLETRIEELCLETKRFLIQSFVVEHPFVRYFHPFMGQSLIALLFQLILMGVYYWWKARSIGYEDGFEDGVLEWNQRWIGAEEEDLSCRDDELWDFCYGNCSSSASGRNRFLLEYLTELPFLGINEIALYKKYIRLLLVDGNPYLVELLWDSYFQEPTKMRNPSNVLEADDVTEKQYIRLYHLRGNISIWSLPWNNVMAKVSIGTFLRHASVDWGSFDSFEKKPFLWQWLINCFGSTCECSILASRRRNGGNPNLFISSYYYRQNICNLLNGIDGIILPVCFSRGETRLKYGKHIIEECLRQQVPIFFVDVSNKEYSYKLSHRLHKAIRRTLIQRAVKIQQKKYISARTQFFVWLYTWRYDNAYLRGYREAWTQQMLSLHDNIG